MERKITLKRMLNRIRRSKTEDASQYMHRVESPCEQLRSLEGTLEDAEVAAIAIRGLLRAYRGIAGVLTSAR